jgi:sugar phosphate isomerase/epimerase
LIPFVDEIEFWRELGVENVGMVFTQLEPIGWDTELVRSGGFRVSNIVCSQRTAFECLEFGAAMGTDVVWLGSSGSIGSRTWEEAADEFGKRIAPVVARAADLGMAFAIQPTNSLRLDISFLHTFRDTLTVARAIGSGVVLELECCWHEPGLEKQVRDNVDRIALVQIDDVKFGDTWSPNRSVIGDGDMPLERVLAMILDAGYDGMFDLELIGPRIEAEGYRSATRRSLERASEILDRLGA